MEGKLNRFQINIMGTVARKSAFAVLVAVVVACAGFISPGSALAQDGPTIDVWYGLDQQFGLPGEPQIWCDILGNVSDPDGVSSLSYTLNGGPLMPMEIGPHGRSEYFGDLPRRLFNDGDFMVDLLAEDLLTGNNTVVIEAIDLLNNVSTETVTISYSPGNSWPATYATDWGSLMVDGDPLTPDPAILEQAHVVDGKWTVIGDSIRTVEPGYDRLINIGDMDWRDYEVTVPVTIHEILPGQQNEFGVGMIFRWNGHTNDPDLCDQPLCGWNPLGDIGWIKNDRLNLWNALDGPSQPFPVQLNTLYMMKMRVETDVTGAVYSLKVWEESQPEPIAWNLTEEHNNDYPMAGSMLLVAHQADVSFGNVSIVPITGPNTPPTAGDVFADAKFDGTTLIDILANDTDLDGVLNPASVTIQSGPTRGTITDIDPMTGMVTYLHDGLDLSADSFTYTVEDNDGAESNVATVSLTVVPNQAPVAVDDAAIVKVDKSVDINVPLNDYDNDGTLDLTSVAIVDFPSNGTIDNIDPVSGVVTFTHDGGIAEADSFTYTINDDDSVVSNTAMVRLTIAPNVPPVANDDAAFVAYNADVLIAILANDIDSDGLIDPTTVFIMDLPQNGSAFVNPVTGVVTYTHTAMTSEPDSFTYTVEDETGDISNLATVRVTVGQEPPEDFFSDDFNSCDVDPIWTFIDPQGDAPTPVISGGFSGDAQIAISVPGGSTHQPYDDFLGAPYVLQAAQDEDFSVDVKFSSTLPDSAYALQGIIVKQDDQNWMRFDFYSTGSNQIRVYGTTNTKDDSFANLTIGNPGDTPLYMRVTRTGDDWFLYYFDNSIGWELAGTKNHVLAVTGIGLYAGNAGGEDAPAFTTFVDYFSNSVDPIVEPDDQEQNSLNVTVSGGGSVGKSPDQAVYTCGEPVQLTANADPDWVFDGWTGDLTGMDNPTTITMDRARYVTANFKPTSGTVIAANTSGFAGISTTVPCAEGIPVEILRDLGTDVREFTVTVALTNLDPCSGTASFIEGDFLSSISPTSFSVIDNGNDTYDVTGSILGTPCGATDLAGTLFTLDATNTIANGTGTIEVISVDLRDCAGAPLAATAGAAAQILIDTIAPTGVTDLALTKVMAGNPAGNVTAVDLTWTASIDPDAVSVLVYRKGFGAYPEYSDGGGSTPVLPADPVAEGWELVNTIPVGSNTTTDLHGQRDYWHFCAQAVDAVGNPSTSVMTGGVLNYLLGDVSDGGAPIADGNNHVGVDDLTLLGSAYGTSDGDAQYLNTLDVGPTADMSVEGLPTTDNQIEFEDLILFGINYSVDVSGSGAALSFPGVPDPAPYNTMAVHLPDLPGVGETFEAELVMAADGQIQGLKIPLVWDAGMVTPIAIQGGPLLTSQGGQSLTLSGTAGEVDICLAGLRESGISGTDRIASVTFRVLAAGDPGIQLEEIDARGQDNAPIMVTTTAASPVDPGGILPAVSALHPNYPNPFNPMTTIAFDLAIAGQVRIEIYSIDGRRIRSLVNSAYAAGSHTEVWDGRDQSGRSVASGTYLYTMDGPRIKQTRRMLLIK